MNSFDDRQNRCISLVTTPSQPVKQPCDVVTLDLCNSKACVTGVMLSLSCLASAKQNKVMGSHSLNMSSDMQLRLRTSFRLGADPYF